MIDADRFLRKIKNAVFYEIPTDQISPYLVEHFITPILQGRKVLYGDLDFDLLLLMISKRLPSLPKKRTFGKTHYAKKSIKLCCNANAIESKVDYF